MKNSLWFVSGMIAGLVGFTCAAQFVLAHSSLRHPASIQANAAMPSKALGGELTDDAALYDNLSEIKAHKALPLNVDGDLQVLAASEARYREKLPSVSKDPRILGPMKRINSEPYRPSQQAGRSAHRK